MTDSFEEGFKFNTAISSIMTLVNRIEKYATGDGATVNQATLNEAIKTVVLLLSPFTPHLCEEMWQKIGAGEKSIAQVSWPRFDEKAVKQDIVQLVVQVNGKLRAKLDVAADLSEEKLKALVLAEAKVKEHLQGKEIKRFIIVPNKLIHLTT